MGDLENYTSWIKEADSGASIAGAEIIAAQLQPLTNIAAASHARAKQVQIGIIANLMDNSATAKFMTLGKAASPSTKMRAMIIGILQTFKNMSQGEKEI